MATANDSALSQGSTWRRWDPHVHLPGTVLNSQFGDLSVTAALNTLAGRRPQIEAVGVTDYCTTASYRAAEAAMRDGAGSGIRFAFPNVELRLDNATSKGKGVNIHMLCAPDDVDVLEEFLPRLEFSYGDRMYVCERHSLERLGRDFSDDPKLDETTAFRIGVEQFKVTFEKLRLALRSDKQARDAILVGVAGGEGDGSSGLRAEDGSFAARRQSIEALANLIFSANPQQIAVLVRRQERVVCRARVGVRRSEAVSTRE